MPPIIGAANDFLHSAVIQAPASEGQARAGGPRGGEPHGLAGEAILAGGLSTDESMAALRELDRRLAVVRDRVHGVALRRHTGFYLFGPPGTAKTFTVRTTLADLGVSYHYQVGHLAPLGLFGLLAERHDQVIVLDDVSALFEQRVALQLLLAALGNQPDGAGGRIIQYRHHGREETIRFTGGIICISNLELHAAPLLEALKSRVHCLKYDPTEAQLVALMGAICSKGWSQDGLRLTPTQCQEVMAHLIAESRRLGCRLDLRLLVDKAFPDYWQWRQGFTETDWQDLVSVTLGGQLIELRHPRRARPVSREQLKRAEQMIVRALLEEFPTPEERVAAWEEQTGKSRRAFYRRLQEVERDTR